MVLSVSSVLCKGRATAQIGLSDLLLAWKFDDHSTLRLDYIIWTMSRINLFVSFGLPPMVRRLPGYRQNTIVSQLAQL
jgi:hypothetical protein